MSERGRLRAGAVAGSATSSSKMSDGLAVGSWRRAVLAAACALALPLAGCDFGGGADQADDAGAAGDGAGDAVVTETVTATEGADDTGETEGADATDGTGETNGTGESNGRDGAAENCGVDENADIISESIKRVEPPSAGDYWELTKTNYDPCGELTYALFHQMPQGSSQFATKILMFHDGEYLGVDSLVPQQGEIIGEGDGWFRVEYRDWEALRDSGEPNAAAGKYSKNITFTWSESEGKVVLDDELPNQNL